jgi:hypothetical protein
MRVAFAHRDPISDVQVVMPKVSGGAFQPRQVSSGIPRRAEQIAPYVIVDTDAVVPLVIEALHSCTADQTIAACHQNMLDLHDIEGSKLESPAMPNHTGTLRTESAGFYQDS